MKLVACYVRMLGGNMAVEKIRKRKEYRISFIIVSETQSNRYESFIQSMT